jgi:hypothetical protein
LILLLLTLFRIDFTFSIHFSFPHLQSYCKLTASLANYYLRFTKDIEEITIQAKTALIQHYSVLARCYDQETNKSVGESLGTL